MTNLLKDDYSLIDVPEYRPFVCIEEGNHSGELEIGGGHDNDQEECVMRIRRIIGECAVSCAVR